ncbi:MAG TPA: hypothetical protein VLI72_04785 [Methylibium sp.]|nr:hypothetical protein [Methylibium sp.]
MLPAYEPRHKPPLPAARFVLRMVVHAGVAGGLIVVSLALGVLGYMHFEGMGLVDAFLNAAMILGGMGPVKAQGLSEPGKIFAGLYALYSGLAFIAVMSIMLAPVVHRILHRFHWSDTPRR